MRKIGPSAGLKEPTEASCIRKAMPGKAQTLGLPGKKKGTEKVQSPSEWWSWRDLNPRPQALFGQIYMFSGLI